MTSPDYLTKSTDRPLCLRARTDLQISTTVFQGETSWIIKDPVALKYFRMREAEYEVFRMLDGSATLGDLQSRLVDRFPQKRYRNHQLQTLIESFHAQGLLVTGAAGQAGPLERRRRKQRNQRVIGTLQSIVSIRFPGVDPERFLAWLYSKVGWAFSRVAVALCLLIIISAAMLVVTHWAEFQARLPGFEQFFGVSNLLLMALMLIGTKTIHELGHGLVCKHFDGECHEMGFMMLVLTPAMYCDTSDSWVLPNKWHRIAIGAAGMWVELVLASICTFVWWYTHPGWLHYVCLNLMFLCGVSTFLFNINPLLRYDGYYMLSDFLEIPNLSKQASLALINQLRVHCLGMDPLPSRMPTRSQLTFAVYSVASFCYRWLVILLIFLFLTKVFEPYGLEAIGYLAISISIVGMIVIPLFKLIRYFGVPGRLRCVKRIRAAVSAVVIAGIVGGVSMFPLPHHVTADFVIKPSGTQSVVVDWPGTLVEVPIRYGDSVARGDLLAQLENPELELSIAGLEMRCASLEAMLKSNRGAQTRSLQPSHALQLAGRIGEIRAELESRKNQLAIHYQLRSRLTLKADRSGVVIPPPNTISTPGDEVTLAKWSDRPLDPENGSAFLDRKTLVCYVGDPNRMTAMLAIPQEEIRFLRPGQKVTLKLNSYRGQRFSGEVTLVSNVRLVEIPRELSATNGGPIATAPQSSGSGASGSGTGGSESPLVPTFEAEVRFEQNSGLVLLPGMKGKARVQVGRRSPAERLYRYLAARFRFN